MVSDCKGLVKQYEKYMRSRAKKNVLSVLVSFMFMFLVPMMMSMFSSLPHRRTTTTPQWTPI